ncbi:hypothetical protein KTE49_13860 [Burkholderia multivorans]|uniref:Uncharacterized protein n=5 Tax=Burkholderia cepacia complex TaxID=87882 RepID=A0A0H3KZ57_BURM1|nr:MULTISPECIES: hypothetical protein [Burkholderia cepacia complex]ABX19239.1 conserved hypothetical protein [Burkholderia multivorans ATCC 17616]AIO71675.1 hypothetical protein DM80_5789 [Burkholderia multivorans]AOK69863.1 hypothetical protein WM33_30275 [Burkholderia multivorans]KVV34437.1 hypothetical protein WK80_03015 [Burkholderia multivorans]KVZ76027.1 hypothetical protein WL23_21735 [Burkholderia multivorans]
MLQSLIGGAFKSPGKFLALCFAVYLAAHSILVSVFLAIAGFHYFKNAAKTARRDAERDAAIRHDRDENPQHANRAQATAARSDVKASTTPQRQYAKSAVVIPLKPAINPAVETMKTGTK